ncbi:MAG: PilZ domain-containing protein [Pseudomonadota bacterium]
MRLGRSIGGSDRWGRRRGDEEESRSSVPGRETLLVPESEPAYMRAIKKVMAPGRPGGGYEHAGEGLPPLPKTKALMRAVLRPRELVDLILRLDLESDDIDVRRSMLHEVDRQGRLVLAQTSPPILPSQVRQVMEATFLYRQPTATGNIWRRVGYRCPLAEVRQRYQVSPGVVEPALVLPGPKEFRASSVRLYYRVEPPAELDLHLFLMPEKSEVRVLDISAGGVGFYHPYGLMISPGSRVNLLLQVGDFYLRLNARVIRQAETTLGRGSIQPYAAVFEDLDTPTRSQLLQLITAISRLVLARRSGAAG